MDPKITIRGKTYNNLKELPSELQSILADENSNGIPDIAENPLKALGKMGPLIGLVTGLAPLMKESMTQLAAQKFIVEGKEYNNWNEVSESAKVQIREKLKNLAAQKAAGNSAGIATQTFVSPPSTVGQNNSLYTTPSAIPGIHQVKTGGFQKALFIIGLLAIAGWILFQYAK